MENKNSAAAAALPSIDGEDVTTWALPEGATARLGRGSVGTIWHSHQMDSTSQLGAWIGLWLYELPTLTPIALWDTERGNDRRCQFFARWQSDCHGTRSAENVKIWDIERGVCVIEIDDHHGKDAVSPNLFSLKTDDTSPLPVTV